MTRDDAKKVIVERIKARCEKRGTEYRENTMTSCAVEVLSEILFAFGDEVGVLEDRIRALEEGTTREGN